jgi:hypothetical protein
LNGEIAPAPPSATNEIVPSRGAAANFARHHAGANVKRFIAIGIAAAAFSGMAKGDVGARRIWLTTQAWRNERQMTGIINGGQAAKSYGQQW